MGPEALMTYMNADEAIKRLAASQGIDYLNLIKSVEERNQEQAQQQQSLQQASLMHQAGQLASAPLMDPSKNPEAIDTMNAAMQQIQGAQQQQQPQLAPV